MKILKYLSKSHPHTEEWKKEHSERMRGAGNPRYGMKLLEETKKKISIGVSKLIGIKSNNWKGGKKITKSGYIVVTSYDHPFKNGNGVVPEHRLVMEESLGRYLASTEIVHHINGNKQDNSIKNLMLFKNSGEHKKLHNQLEVENAAWNLLEELLC